MRTKKPPPDTVENLLGRMQMLLTAARQNARVEATEPEALPRMLERQLKAVEPRMKDLKKRLARVRKIAVPEAEAEAEAEEETSPGETLLEALGSLRR
jgi:hypothetical protein